MRVDVSRRDTSIRRGEPEIFIFIKRILYEVIKKKNYHLVIYLSFSHILPLIPLFICEFLYVS